MLQQIRDICHGCDTLQLIQNKKLWLCAECVFKRNHDGKTREQVYRERSEAKGTTEKLFKKIQQRQERKKKEWGNSKMEHIKGKIKKASRIKQISNFDKYLCSDGTRISQAEIKFRLANAYDNIKHFRPPVCQGTGRSDVPLSFSHTISQQRCKDLGKAELIIDPDNIEIEGFEERTSKPTAAHNIWEDGSLEQKVKLLNFTRKLKYIKKHDNERYQKLIFELKQMGYETI